MRKGIKIACIGAIFFAPMISATSIAATILDDDDNCLQYGCVLVHDGANFKIFDVYDNDRDRCCVATNALLSSRFSDVSVFSLNQTGTLNDATIPEEDHGILFGVSQDGGTTYGSFTIDDGDGFLDASDTAQNFGIDNQTQIGFIDSALTYSHSFYITSKNTRFFIKGQAFLNRVTGDISENISLEDISVQMIVTRNGTDDGYDFGSQAFSGQLDINDNIQTLADLSSGPVEFLSSRRRNGIVKSNNGNGNGGCNNNGNGNGNGNPRCDATLGDQSLRLDLVYSIPKYDMSMGTGSLDIDLVLDFYNQ